MKQVLPSLPAAEPGGHGSSLLASPDLALLVFVSLLGLCLLNRHEGNTAG